MDMLVWNFKMLFLTYVSGVYTWDMQAVCPPFQVPHNTTSGVVCCHPVLLCPLDSQIKFCTSNGGRDTCEECPQGWHGTYITSSLDEHPEQCFQYSSKHRTCALDDNAWTELSKAKHGMPCRCDEARCYHGSPSEFGCLYKECDNDAELDPYTGECKQCGPLRFKKDVCGSCLVNETKWKLSEEKRFTTTNKGISAAEEQADSLDITAVTTNEPRNSELHLFDTKQVISTSPNVEEDLYRTPTSPYVKDDVYRRPTSPNVKDDLYRTTTSHDIEYDRYRTVFSIAAILFVILNTVLIVLLILRTRMNFKKKRTPSQEELLKDSQNISECSCKGTKVTIGCRFCTVFVCECQPVSFV